MLLLARGRSAQFDRSTADSIFFDRELGRICLEADKSPIVFPLVSHVGGDRYTYFLS